MLGITTVNWIDPWGLSASEKKQQAQENQSKWINNGDGTYTAQEGATLWGLQQQTGKSWQSFGYSGNPKNLQIGEIVGQKRTYYSLLDPISISDNNSDNNSFFSNHKAFTSYKSKNGADAFYAGADANFDIKNGNFNLNAKTGIANYEGSWSVFKGSHKFNFGLSGRASGISADGVVGLEGSMVGASGGAQIFKGGGTVDITLFGLKVSIGGDAMVGGVGAGLQLGAKGLIANLDIGFGAGVQITWEFVK